MPRIAFPTVNPIYVSIDRVAFNDVAFDVKSASLWPTSYVSDVLRVDFTITNHSQQPISPDSTVTADVLDGEITVMSSGYTLGDFLSPSAVIQHPLTPGLTARGYVLMKWDSKWVSKPKGIGYCALHLQYWGQYGEYHPDAGDLTFLIPGDRHVPKTDTSTPPVPGDEVFGGDLPLPGHRPVKSIFFRKISDATEWIDVCPGCGRGGDFLYWPELSATILSKDKQQQDSLWPIQGGDDCHNQTVIDGVSIALSWKVANGGFPAVGNHPGSITDVTISGPGIAGEVKVEAMQVEPQANGVITRGEISPVQIGGMKVVDAIKPFVLKVRGQCGEVKACAVLLPGYTAFPYGHFNNWAGNQTSLPQARSWPTTVETLVGIIQQAEAHGKQFHVRAAGSGWSFSDVAITNDYLVQTTTLEDGVGYMNRTLGWAGGPKLPNCPPIMRDALTQAASGRKLYHVEAGITIRELYTRMDNQLHENESRLPEARDALAAANRSNQDAFNCAQVDAIPAINVASWSHGRWALPTMGNSGGQALGGAISTSVHGGDFSLAPLPDIVRAIHLVGAGGKQYWIEPSTPITDRQILASILPDVDIIYNDEWFRAVLVSMGCMGIIYSLVIEVDDQYGLEEVRGKSTWSTVRQWLQTGQLFTSPLPPWLNANRKDQNQPFAPRYLEISLIPYPEKDKDHICFVTSRAQIAVSEVKPLPRRSDLSQFEHDNANFDGLSSLVVKDADDIYNEGIAEGWWTGLISRSINQTEVLGRLTNAAEVRNNVALMHDLSSMLFEQVILDPLRINSKALSYEIMDSYEYSLARGKQWRVLSLEIAIDASDTRYLEFIDHLFTVIDNAIQVKKFIAGVLSLRFTAASGAYLAMQQTNRTCHIEVDLLKFADSTRGLLDQFAAAAVAFGGRLHWGLNATQTCSLAYPQLSKWKAIRKLMTNDGTVHTFDNEFSARCGLTS